MTEQEFIEQIKANKNTIHKVCNAYCVTYPRKDLVQDIIAETWRSLAYFKNNCKFNVWLYGIARNVCVSTLRKKNREPYFESLDDYIETLAAVDNTPELIKQLHEAKRYSSVLDSIQQPYRELFHMYVYGASFKELEQHSGISANNLRVNIFRIKKRLQLRYGNDVI